MVRFNREFSQKSKGQAMAEFALTIPVFLLLVFGIIELSRFFLVYSSVFTAVREATRYGSSVGDEGILNYLDCSEIAETAVRTGHFGGVQKDLVQISYESVAPESDEVRVSIASCPNNDPGTVPTRADDGKNYVPSLGDRIYIEIATDYVSLLGVVPNLTVNASNGRTIMMGIQNQVAANPPADDEEDGEDDGGDDGGDEGGEDEEDQDSCPTDPITIGSIKNDGKTIRYLEVTNSSSISFELYSIIIDYEDNGNKKLSSIKDWNDGIWKYENSKWIPTMSNPIIDGQASGEKVIFTFDHNNPTINSITLNFKASEIDNCEFTWPKPEESN